MTSAPYRVYPAFHRGDHDVAASLRVAPIHSVAETTDATCVFPGTGDLAEAQRLKLGLGAEVTATFPLSPVRPARVSGVVLNAAGGPANAFLSLESEATELGMPIGACGVTRSDGTFNTGRCRTGPLPVEALSARRRPRRIGDDTGVGLR